MNWHVTVAISAQKELKRIPRQDEKKIAGIISSMSDDPFFGDIQHMPEKNVWRRRVGSYRIFYKIYKDLRMVYVFEITRRASNTY